ncbi:hypothetical protein BDM02DRAFT_3113085 [Thelephora ganbajun]|uniref:Uncharacterized protein n=1 Tax=Thelephora ganbajun TaxID=370292 RepID=A0ACB6ZJR2_THEGA|nr:hypothetical protein BDM02DRAFT_3113085 [Thelephora ganbajun]
MVIRRQKSKRTRRPRGQGPPRLHRAPAQKDASKLCNWVQGRKNLREVPSLNRALTGKHIFHYMKQRA